MLGLAGFDLLENWAGLCLPHQALLLATLSGAKLSCLAVLLAVFAQGAMARKTTTAEF